MYFWILCLFFHYSIFFSLSSYSNLNIPPLCKRKPKQLPKNIYVRKKQLWKIQNRILNVVRYIILQTTMIHSALFLCHYPSNKVRVPFYLCVTPLSSKVTSLFRLTIKHTNKSENLSSLLCRWQERSDNFDNPKWKFWQSQMKILIIPNDNFDNS